MTFTEISIANVGRQKVKNDFCSLTVHRSRLWLHLYKTRLTDDKVFYIKVKPVDTEIRYFFSNQLILFPPAEFINKTFHLFYNYALLM